MPKYRIRVTRDYWHEGYVEVEAPDEQQAGELAVDEIDSTEMKIGGVIQDTDHYHEVEEIKDERDTV